MDKIQVEEAVAHGLLVGYGFDAVNPRLYTDIVESAIQFPLQDSLTIQENIAAGLSKKFSLYEKVQHRKAATAIRIHLFG